VNIRKFVVRADRLDDLVGLRTVTRHTAAFLDAAVRAGLTVLVSGGTQAGKPTRCRDTRRLNCPEADP
jgi:pilus assembly protein CpaF